jgi:radical SAM protein with 4Fe4S-binding SPASM domain
LNTEQCLEVIARLDEMGCREINLIGGEAYLRRDWLELVREITQRGIHCGLQTGGRNLNKKRITDAYAAGLRHVGLSIDGMADVHDEQRGVPGSFDKAMEALEELRAQGFTTVVNTQLNRLSVPQLPALMERLIQAGVRSWRFQLTVAMGRAADQHEILLQPWEVPEVLRGCQELARRALPLGLEVSGGNNIGYYGPTHAALRGGGMDQESQVLGCGAGRTVLGLEADGTIKGCPSLPTTDYSGGNVLRDDLRQVWEQAPELAARRQVRREDLSGFCATCYYGDACQAGCTWTSHVLFGRPGDNPYCEHRALTLAQRGLREEIQPVRAAPGEPFDHGLFKLVYTDLEGQPVEPDPEDLRDPMGPLWTGGLNDLTLCRACDRYHHPADEVCPFCGQEAASGALLQQLVSDETSLVGDLRDLLSLLQGEQGSEEDRGDPS